MPERQRRPSAGVNTDGAGAGAFRASLIEIMRGPTPVLPAILERVGVNLLVGSGGPGGGKKSETSQQQHASPDADCRNEVNWRYDPSIFSHDGAQKDSVFQKICFRLFVVSSTDKARIPS